MILTAIFTLIIGIFSIFWRFLPPPNATAVTSIGTAVTTYIFPMFALMRAYLPMDTIWFWVKLVLGLRLTLITYKIFAKIMRTLSGGLIRIDFF